MGTKQYFYETIVESLPSQLTASSVNVIPSTYLIKTLTEVIVEPPLSGLVQVILTLLLSTVNTGSAAVNGTFDALTLISVDSNENPTELRDLTLNL